MRTFKIDDVSECLLINWNQFSETIGIQNIAEIFESIKNKLNNNLIVVFHMETETVSFEENNIIELHDWFDRNDYNPNNIYFIQENPNLKYFYDIFCKEKQIKRKFNFVQRIIKRSSDMSFAPELSSHPHLKRSEFENTKGIIRNKKILTFNSTPRPHREDLVEFLLPYKEQCYMSLNASTNKYYGVHFPNDLELKIDEEFTKGLGYLYMNSYFNVVTETEFYNNSIHVTEKTWRPFAQFQPFIIMTGPFVLDYLRDIGFKLPVGLIDYSYDKEVDSKKRMLMIQEELNKILNMNIKDLHEWYWSNEDILIHNNNTYYNESLYEDNSYLDFQTVSKEIDNYIKEIING